MRLLFIIQLVKLLLPCRQYIYRLSQRIVLGIYWGFFSKDSHKL